MTNTYRITGMTCQGCVASIKEKLLNLAEVESVHVNLEKAEAELETAVEIPVSVLREALPDKYIISEKGNDISNTDLNVLKHKSKWVQLRPLFLIFIYLFGASFLLNFKNWDTGQAMFDFMGLFYIVFSFFKFLDLKGFPESFRMYDPLTRAIPPYGRIYPFIELALGIMFLMRFQIPIALIVTIVILGITTIGVTKVLLSKKQIRCACLGTALKLPMTEATFIENTIMLVMAISMLLTYL